MLSYLGWALVASFTALTACALFLIREIRRTAVTIEQQDNNALDNDPGWPKETRLSPLTNYGTIGTSCGEMIRPTMTDYNEEWDIQP